MNKMLSRPTIILALMSASSFGSASDGTAELNLENWSLGGVVTDALGKSLDGAQVVSDGPERLTATTDGAGHYTLKGTKPGRWAVFAKKDGYVSARVRWMQLTTGMDATLNLRLNREAILAGTVLAENGAPFVAVQVIAWGREFQDGKARFLPSGKAITDDRGQYRIAGLPEGTYFVGASTQTVEIRTYRPPEPKAISEPQLNYPTSFYPGVASFDEASPVFLRSSEERDQVNLRVNKVPTFCATGTVTGIRTKVALMLSAAAKGWGAVIGSGEASPGQRFELCGLVPGNHYTLAAQLWGEGSKLGGLAEQEFEGTRRDADLHFLDLGSLSVEPGQPVPGQIRVEGTKSDSDLPKKLLMVLRRITSVPGYINETNEIEVEHQGQFAFSNVFPYQHSLRVFGLAAGYYVEQATCGRYDLLEEPWQPGCGEVHVLLGADAASISGQAVDENGTPVDTADIVLVSDGTATRVLVQQVDQHGVFQYSSVAPGQYKIFALVGISEKELQNPDVVREYLSDATELDLGPKDRQSMTLTVASAAR